MSNGDKPNAGNTQRNQITPVEGRTINMSQPTLKLNVEQEHNRNEKDRRMSANSLRS